MEKFAGYGFNKSHSAAYALLSYQTAYLKAHYPAQFMAAVLSADMDHTDKVVTLIKECSDMGLAVLSPDVNASRYEFTACGARSIRYGLGAVRGVGRGAVEAIIAGREAHGPYRSLEDLCRRLDLQKVNRRVLEALLRSGSLDALGANRATLMDRLGAALQLGEQNSRAHQAGQDDLFGLAADGRDAALEPQRRSGAAGVERGGAPRRRARYARPVPHRSPAGALRVRAGALRLAPHRRPGERPAARRPRVGALRRGQGGDGGRTHR